MDEEARAASTSAKRGTESTADEARCRARSPRRELRREHHVEVKVADIHIECTE